MPGRRNPKLSILVGSVVLLALILGAVALNGYAQPLPFATAYAQDAPVTGDTDSFAAAPGVLGAAASAGDWAAVQSAGKIRVGTAGDNPTFEYYGDDFALDGFDIALMKALGKELGIEVEFADYAFAGLPAALQLGNIDAIIAGLTETPHGR
ncbi:MAG: transporter substrate-binding domain-containing protein [Anaerolineales bacterium]|nr:transporter substrate-binding domain-containing protein [Anaerolineales bacterium]